MKLDISDVESSANQNFLDYIRNEKTRRKYSKDLEKFLELIPDKIYQERKIDTTDKTEAFVTLVRDLKTIKLFYVCHSKIELSHQLLVLPSQ